MRLFKRLEIGKRKSEINIDSLWYNIDTMNNTKKQGQLRFIIYRKKQDKHFTGVCLDLDIVEQNKDPEILRKNLEEAAKGYIEAVSKCNLSDELLNKKVPKKYLKIIEDLEEYLSHIQKDSLISNGSSIQDSQIFTRNVCELACA